MDKITLYRFFDGFATDQEVGQIRAWAESSPENQRELFSERKIFDALLLLADTDKRDVRQMRQRPVHRLQQKRVIRLRIPQMAAMLAVVFALGLLAYPHIEQEKKTKVEWYETLAPLGAKSQVSLTDGTKVWLNAGSRLLYSTGFGQQNREVRLEGEAYFEVAKSAALPFEVKTSRITVKALGTAFNVKAYPNEATIETILVEGEVEVSQVVKTKGADRNETVLLKPMQRLTLKKNTNEMLVEANVQEKAHETEQLAALQEKTVVPTVKTVEVATDLMIYTTWKDKQWRIESEELGSFAIQLERRYNVKISFQDNNLPKLKFNGTFEDEPIEELLRALAFAAPVNFSLKGNEVILSWNNKFKDAYQTLYKQSW